MLELFSHITGMLDETSKEHLELMNDFLTHNSTQLLHSLCEYLRKELKVPEYSDNELKKEIRNFDEEYKQESEEMFEENPQLESKLKKL